MRDTVIKAGLKVDVFDGGPAVGNPPRGLIVRISDIGGVEDEAAALHQALSVAGLNPVIVKDRRVAVGKIILMVGIKP